MVWVVGVDFLGGWLFSSVGWFSGCVVFFHVAWGKGFLELVWVVLGWF